MTIHLIVLGGMLVLYLLAWKKSRKSRSEKIKRPFSLCADWLYRTVFRENVKISRKILSELLLFVALCNVFGGILSWREVERERQNVRKVLRNQEEASTKELEIWLENGEKKAFTLEIPPRSYTKEEAQVLLKKAKERLQTSILGENSSLLEVKKPLKLLTSLEDSPVQIAWTSSNPLILDWSGAIGEEAEPTGSRVTLLAELFLEGQTESMTLETIVFPPEQTVQEAWSDGVQREIRKWNEGKGGADYELPDTLGGKAVSWHLAGEHTGNLLLFLAVIGALGIIVGKLREGALEEQKKEAQMLADYPGIVSKLLLLLGAGLSMRKAIQRIAGDYQRKRGEVHSAYEELVQTVRDMECGISEKEAYERFGNRCKCAPYRSLSILLVRNLQKGSRGLAVLLEKEASDSFENRKRQAKILGDKISTKLLLPMGIMLILVLAILILPAFLSFSV